MKVILIADDDPMMVKLLDFTLRRAGFATRICHDGASVCARAKAEHPDMAILDVRLPGRTGLELLHDFKADPELVALPVVICTSEGKSSTQDELLAAGALHVFTKPFSPTLLINYVRQVLNEPAPPPQPTPQ